MADDQLTPTGIVHPYITEKFVEFDARCEGRHERSNKAANALSPRVERHERQLVGLVGADGARGRVQVIEEAVSDHEARMRAVERVAWRSSLIVGAVVGGIVLLSQWLLRGA